MVIDSLMNESYFFTKKTMKFWGSKIVAGMYDNDAFVTIEDNFERTKKLYTSRYYDWDKHRVEDISRFQEFDNLEDAIRSAKEYIQT